MRKGGVIVHTLLILALVFILLGVLPTWQHSSTWGYRPTWGVGGVLLVVILLIAFGAI